MKIININIIDRNDLFFCYSPNLYKFLRWYKKIEPIDIKTHKKTCKKYSIFVKCDILQNALDEWKNNKLTGDLFCEVTNNSIQVGENYG